MECLSFQVPQISISPAAPEEPPSAEPFSPFTGTHFNFAESLVDGQDSYRPALLTPPPTHSPKVSSPLRPIDGNVERKGLDQSRFQALLAASKERNGVAKKSTDLRKEVALKTHQSKQMERRALFLSKVQAPPSPSATFTPKTPPESPAMFHYSLPSPGLASPLALYEAMGPGNELEVSPWVEQVDFRLPEQKKPPSSLKRPVTPLRASPLPSLDQITARLSKEGHAPLSRESSRGRRLPAFLKPENAPKTPTIIVSEPDAPAVPAPRPRLNLPFGVTRQSKPSSTTPASIDRSKLDAHTACGPPASPRSPLLQVTTTIVPRSTSASPKNLTESNVFALNSRVRTARDMMSTLRRRMSYTPSDCGVVGHAETPLAVTADERKLRRISAPAELPRRERCEFAHPVLNLPGGF